MTIEWNPGFETCDAQIDYQHKCLFVLVNRLIHATDSLQARECTQRLLDYLDAHCAYEEMTMHKSHYPEEASHCLDHTKLRTKMRALQDNQPNLPPALYKFQLVVIFKEWIQHHIPEHDARLAEFLSYGDTCQASL
ncbi:MAG: hypothetical protein RIR79_436 [Pseudomonadota bacterium]|jgi:hemerythrin